MYEQNYQNGYPMEEGMRKHAMRTFGWMGLALLVTAISAAFFYFSGIYLRLYLMLGGLGYFLMIALQFGVVIAFSARLTERSVGTTRMLFLAYALITGLTFSVIGLLYDARSIMFAFGITAIYYGALAVIGYTTRINLMKFGPLLYISLIVLIISEIVLALMGTSGDTMLLTTIGLLIFTGLTAYDVQKMKVLYLQCEDEALRERLSVYSAFELYLDFINIFLYILRFVGNRN